MRNDPFAGFFAEFHEILHAGLEDAGAFIEFASRYGPRVLELGCGAGRVLIPLARAGFTVTGVDSSKDMMVWCRERLGYEPEEVQRRVTVVEADAMRLRLKERFDLVIAPCNFLNYFTAPGDARRVLRVAGEHLGPSGALLLDNSVPDLAYMREVDGVTREYEFEHPLTGASITFRITARYDFARQLEFNHMELVETVEDGADPEGAEEVVLRSDTAGETLTYYSPSQMRGMLAEAGFEVVHEQGSLMENIPVSEDGGEMVFLCRRKGG